MLAEERDVRSMGEFIVSLPLSILVINPKWTENGEWILDRSTQVVSGGPPNGPVFLSLFTDDDLAERYRQQTGISAEIVLLDTPLAVAEVAKRMKRFHGCSHVAIDPHVSLSSQRLPTLPIDEFISVCESQSSEPPTDV
jgi:hypothetical protein